LKSSRFTFTGKDTLHSVNNANGFSLKESLSDVKANAPHLNPQEKTSVKIYALLHKRNIENHIY